MEKSEKSMKIDFNTETTYGDDDEYIKTRIKTYKDSIITNFCNKSGSKKILEEKVPHKCLSIITLVSIIYACEKNYPQTFLEECKYMQEKIKTKNYVNEELKSEHDTDSDIDSDIDIHIYKLSEVTASIIKYTSILIVNCLQELINNLLNLQTRYPIATNKSYQNFITDIVKLK